MLISGSGGALTWSSSSESQVLQSYLVMTSKGLYLEGSRTYQRELMLGATNPSLFCTQLSGSLSILCPDSLHIGRGLPADVQDRPGLVLGGQHGLCGAWQVYPILPQELRVSPRAVSRREREKASPAFPILGQVQPAHSPLPRLRVSFRATGGALDTYLSVVILKLRGKPSMAQISPDVHLCSGSPSAALPWTTAVGQGGIRDSSPRRAACGLGALPNTCLLQQAVCWGGAAGSRENTLLGDLTWPEYSHGGFLEELASKGVLGMSRSVPGQGGERACPS